MATGSFDAFINAPYQGRTSEEIQGLSVDALKGVSSGDRDHLRAAFGIESVGDLALNRFVRAARAIQEDAADLGHDPGPDVEWTRLFASAPLAVYQEHPKEFRLEFGPVYYRGRLDGTARVLVVGQDPAPNELVGHRAFVGASGQRVQGFLRRLGVRRDYLMLNTFLYPVYGQFTGTLADLSRDSPILTFRNALFDRIAQDNALEAVVAVGNAAQDAVERWPGAEGLAVQHIMHPSARDHAALLATWNDGLTALRAVVSPEVGATVDPSTYGQDFVESDHEPIPRRDLPFGMPEWHGVGSHARRGRTKDGRTDPREISWRAPGPSD